MHKFMNNSSSIMTLTPQRDMVYHIYNRNGTESIRDWRFL